MKPAPSLKGGSTSLAFVMMSADISFFGTNILHIYIYIYIFVRSMVLLVCHFLSIVRREHPGSCLYSSSLFQFNFW